jgi:hypothetical protein
MQFRRVVRRVFFPALLFLHNIIGVTRYRQHSRLALQASDAVLLGWRFAF